MDPTIASSLVGAAGAPVVMALVSALVKPLTDDARFYSAASIILGVLWNLLLAYALVEAGIQTHVLIASVVILGVLSGLAASGLYSSASAQSRTVNPPALLSKGR